MEYQLKSALVTLVLAFQLGLVSSAPIHINRHVPNASTHPEELPPVEPTLILRHSELDRLPPPNEPVKILRSTDQDVIIQISRSPGSYLKNETIRLQITNGEVISSKEDDVVSSKEGSVIWSRHADVISSEEGSVEVRSSASGQSVEVVFVTLGPVVEDWKPAALVTEAKKMKKDKKKFSAKEVGQKLNLTVAEKVYKDHAEKRASLFEEIHGVGSVGGNPAPQKEPLGYNGNPQPSLQSIVLPKSAAEKSNLNRIRKQKFENNFNGPPKSIRKGLLLKEIEINGKKHNNFGVFDEELSATNKTVQPRRADLRLKDNQLLDNVINSAVSSIANRKPSSLLQRQALRGPSINQLPQNTSPLLNLGQSKFVPPPLPSPINAPPSLFNPLLRAERLDTAFDGLDRLVNALSRIDYYISNSAKHVLTMLTHQHNTDYRMKRPEPEDDDESNARYFRSTAKKQPQHEKLYFLHS